MSRVRNNTTKEAKGNVFKKNCQQFYTWGFFLIKLMHFTSFVIVQYLEKIELVKENSISDYLEIWYC